MTTVRRAWVKHRRVVSRKTRWWNSERTLSVSRVLALIATTRPAAGQKWLSARVTIADLAPDHLSYPAVSQAVASGVMPLDGSGAFQLLRPVTGTELVDVIARLEALGKP